MAARMPSPVSARAHSLQCQLTACSLTSLLLNLFAVVQQLQGRQVCTGQHGCIQKCRLLSDVHRSRFIQERDACHLLCPAYMAVTATEQAHAVIKGKLLCESANAVKAMKCFFACALLWCRAAR